MTKAIHSFMERIQPANTHAYNHDKELAALIKLSSLNTGYVPWTTSSMSPEAVVYILNEIVVNSKRQILELGMGVTTTYIAALIKDGFDTKLLSVDHDIEWIETCQKQLHLHNLVSPNHSFVHAPLIEDLSMGYCSPWYDIGRIVGFPTFRPDLLIIDGPPAWNKEIENARVPAFKALSQRLSENATVFIDDFMRTGETILLSLFESDLEWNLIMKDERANVAILRRTGANCYNTF
jgi:hypothetical protein